MQTPRRWKARGEGYVEGQLLVAMPVMTDRRFARSVIYMCAHSAEGAMGLIVNQRAPHIGFRELLKQLKIAPDKGILVGPAEMDVHVGGPVETGRGFVLHSSDYYAADSTLALDHALSLPPTIP